MKNYFKRLTPRHWSWIHFKFALGIGWGSAMFLVPPDSLTIALTNDSLAVWSIGTMIGGIVSIVGIFMTVSLSDKWKMRGLGTEIVGLILLGGGPLQYCLIQIGFLIEGSLTNRYALAWFAYAMIAAIIARGVQIVPTFVRQIVTVRRDDHK